MGQNNVKQVTAPVATALGYFRSKDAAKFLGVSLATLWTWVRTKDDFPRPFKPTESVTLFSVAELDAWVKSSR